MDTIQLLQKKLPIELEEIIWTYKKDVNLAALHSELCEWISEKKEKQFSWYIRLECRIIDDELMQCPSLQLWIRYAGEFRTEMSFPSRPPVLRRY